MSLTMSMSHNNKIYYTGDASDEGTLYGKSHSAQELSISSFLPEEPLFTYTGTAGEQHNDTGGPLHLILMSYYSSLHYPCY